MENDIVFITGKAAVGKSTLSNEFERKGYMVVSMDEVIREKVLPKLDEIKEEPWIVFKLYKDDSNPTINMAREMFIDEMRKIIDGNRKLVIEGSLTNCDAIKRIFENRKFTLFYVRPKDEETYVSRLKERFCKQPDDYGRMGFLRSADTNGSALNDYKRNGITGNLITELIIKVARQEYPKVEETYQHYKKQFDVTTYLN